MAVRIFVEKRPEFAVEANQIARDARELLGINSVRSLRICERYDVFGASDALIDSALLTVFADPVTEVVSVSGASPASLAASDSVDADLSGADWLFAVQFLPGQFDQRADSAQACLRLLSPDESPQVSCARIFLVQGELSDSESAALKHYLMNPVERQEIDPFAPPNQAPRPPEPAPVPTLTGFTRLSRAELAAFGQEYGLAMDDDDLALCQEHFSSEDRDPTLTELRVIDTYWSDHCRHTTFLTELTDISTSHPAAAASLATYRRLREELGVTKPETLMDMATIATKYLRRHGDLPHLDESDEINACTVKTTATIDGRQEPWLVLFKNETHNHPTEIEPFGGAATCIGGAIRDPLSGRSYVYQAMRVTGAGDPRTPLAQTLPGKLPQRQIVTEAAQGYSSYGNQIGLATGLVKEIYHPGYLAKRMEIGAVVGAAPAKNVVREEPQPGDVVILLGGKTGRDGCGGATGSSKTHTATSLDVAGPEVQKGNAPEERKLQRLFRNPQATKLIKRCNDFGAGGVCVAIGELAPGLEIDLDRVPKKYAGLDGTELAISESQERMAVVVAADSAPEFLGLAAAENLEATVVAQVSDSARLVMQWRGEKIVDLSRAFLDTFGAPKTASASIGAPREVTERPLLDLNLASQRGLSERFDSTVGAGTVFMPAGGKYQETPIQAMAATLPRPGSSTATVMSYGFDPYLSDADPYWGAYLAVVESLSKLVATGADLSETYLSFQEYFPAPGSSPQLWGQPVAALLGALQAQLDFSVAAIGGKDSMSGTFEDLKVPSTLVSFALAITDSAPLISPEFKAAGSRLAVVSAPGAPSALDPTQLRANWDQVLSAIRSGEVLSARALGLGGVDQSLFEMSLGNRIGFALESDAGDDWGYGAIVVETTPDSTLGTTIGRTVDDFSLNGSDGADRREQWELPLESIFPTKTPSVEVPPTVSSSTAEAPRRHQRPPLGVRPKFLVPVFPGTNCEYDTAAAIERAGGEAQIFVVSNQSPADITASTLSFADCLSRSQVLFIPGGFSGGDEPAGSAKLIAAFLRNPHISDQVERLLADRDGLIAGICNGFQALIKLGLLPYGKITAPSAQAPTLTTNRIGRHQSRLVRTRVSSTLSPWLAQAEVGQIVSVPISHGEGRLVASPETLAQWQQRGQIATQYVDFDDYASLEIDYNPAGSTWAIEGLTSPDGRIFGKMGHSERHQPGLYRNVPGEFNLGMFTSAVEYFQ